MIAPLSRKAHNATPKSYHEYGNRRKGAPKKPTMEKRIQITFSVKRKYLDLIDNLADANNQTRSREIEDLVVESLVARLEKLEKRPEVIDDMKRSLLTEEESDG